MHGRRADEFFLAVRQYGLNAVLAAIAKGVRFRPFRLLIAYLETESEKRFARLYTAEMLWGINQELRKEWEYPHFTQMLESESDKEAQKKRDDEERRKVYEWLMGGEG